MARAHGAMSRMRYPDHLPSRADPPRGAWRVALRRPTSRFDRYVELQRHRADHGWVSKRVLETGLPLILRACLEWVDKLRTASPHAEEFDGDVLVPLFGPDSVHFPLHATIAVLEDAGVTAAP